MAKAVAPPNERDKLKAEALQRLADARLEKTKVQTDIEECYFFLAPRRMRGASSQSSGGKPGDDKLLQTSLGFEVADDFLTMLSESFTPPEGKWAERKADPSLDDDDREEVNEQIKPQDEKIFNLIRASNFYAELARTGVPDAAIGVVGMLITDPGRGQQVQCLGVPIRETDIALGPDGRIDDRFITRKTKYRHLPALLPGVNLSDEVRKKIKQNGNDGVEVVWGWWRNWEKAPDVEWRHVVLVNGMVEHEAALAGDGSCPFLIGRFGATPDFAWPDGPAIKSLPSFRQLDDLRAALIENIDFTIRPPKAYEDDGVINVDGGIEPGMAYPKRPNGGRQIFEDIYEPRPIDAALFDVQNLEQKIRRLHYVDFPEQRGKTPPSATQWLDEMVIRQRRIGTPGYAYWREFPYEVFQRFRYLGEIRGTVRSPLDLGIPEASTPQPYNPAQQAQENQEVLNAARLGQLGASMFPQEWQLAADGVATLQKLQTKLGDKIVQWRSPGDMQTAAGLIAQVAGTGGAPEGGITEAV